MQKRLNQSGFSAIEGLLILIIVAIIGFVGYFVWHAKKNADQQYDSASKIASSSVTENSQKNTQPSTSSEKLYTLVDSHVSFKLPSDWEVTSQKEPSNGCYTNINSQATCADSALLVLKSEGYANGDQFDVQVSVFNKDDTKSAKDWFTDDLHDGEDTNHTFDGFTTSAGLNGFKYVAPYTDEQRTQYGVVNGKYAVTVYCDFFSGDHYSFKGTTDYTVYQPEVEAIAKSIVIK